MAPTPETQPDEPEVRDLLSGGEIADTTAHERPERGQREELLRAELEPLGEDERPPALLRRDRRLLLCSPSR